MYTDNTLTPREAVRLCALGTLAGGTLRYDALVHEVRHFVSRITGPSLELMGESIELLRYEGLVTAVDEDQGDDPELAISDEGRSMLKDLLCANIRAGSNDLNELIMALKFRFLHLLDITEQVDQVELLIEACESEAARLEDLRNYHEGDSGHLTDWLDHNINRIESRLDWLNEFEKKIKTRN